MFPILLIFMQIIVLGKSVRLEFGSDPEEIFTAICPSICQDCYEVSEDVILEFQKAFEEKYWEKLFYKKKNGQIQTTLFSDKRRAFPLLL